MWKCRAPVVSLALPQGEAFAGFIFDIYPSNTYPAETEYTCTGGGRPEAGTRH